MRNCDCCEGLGWHDVADYPYTDRKECGTCHGWGLAQHGDIGDDCDTATNHKIRKAQHGN